MTTKRDQSDRYIPDLERRLSCCSKNYHKIAQLLPTDFMKEASMTVSLGHVGELTFFLDQLSEYTWTLQIQHRISGLPGWLSGATIKVQLYHDAKLAEAVAFVGNECNQDELTSAHFHALYPNEKQELDDFLGEWLDIAIVEQGR